MERIASPPTASSHRSPTRAGHYQPVPSDAQTRTANPVLPPQPLPMPRNARKSGACFLIGVINLICFLLLGYIVVLLIPLWLPEPNSWALGMTISFGVICSLLITSFFKSVATDPGSVPPNWGFYMGDVSKRRRYCRVCNVWKPDRTHHCSACGRCVLNMDHHCPWINNCVGFYNRRYFLQLLVFSLAGLLFISIHGICHLFSQVVVFWPGFQDTEPPTQARRIFDVVGYGVVCLMLVISLTLIFGLIPFTRFHMNLAARNSTTIENMDAQSRESQKFDLGARRNLQQVFGESLFASFLPCGGQPVGDGVRWTQHYLRVGDEP